MSPANHAALLSDETLPLSARKSHLRLQQAQARASTLAFPVYSSTTPSATAPRTSGVYPPLGAQYPHAAAPVAQGPIVTAPAPAVRRSSTDPALRQNNMLHAWRASMVADQRRSTSVDSPWTGDAASAQLQMPVQKKKGWRDAQTKNGTEGWGTPGEGQRMRHMGAREMDSAHREVLRRMQAGANRRLQSGDA